jgi:FlaA1/EpsC-like NDP-sugar epimerase
MLTNKVLLITGGTGSFGNALIEYILDNKINYTNFHLDIGYVSQNFYIMKDSLINNIVFDDNEKNINFKRLDHIMSIV